MLSIGGTLWTQKKYFGSKKMEKDHTNTNKKDYNVYTKII